MNHKQAAALFANWDEAMIWSCLQGYMGRLHVDDAERPSSAIAEVGGFCFCAGRPEGALLRALQDWKLLIPRDAAWQAQIERDFSGRVRRITRYAIRKEPDVFDTEKLRAYADSLGDGYTVRLFDDALFEEAHREKWSEDLCPTFRDDARIRGRAVGAAAVYHGRLVAGASSYAVYDRGIEIEIDTDPEHRGRGLATACGARLILECLSQGLYPSWDAHDLRSVHLAEKLGYHLAHPYAAYVALER